VRVHTVWLGRYLPQGVELPAYTVEGLKETVFKKGTLGWWGWWGAPGWAETQESSLLRSWLCEGVYVSALTCLPSTPPLHPTPPHPTPVSMPSLYSSLFQPGRLLDRISVHHCCDGP
jgi:hypothetical protein